jgi:tripartite-type tricarboxylate transporter receptor subunit TctC
VTSPGRRRRLAGCLSIVLALLATVPAGAGDYPGKPIRLIVPFAPGGAAQIVAEIVDREMARLIGQPIVPDYHGGAAGTIGTEIAAKAPPDGYTVFLVSTTQAISPAIYESVQFDITRDFVPITLLATVPYVLVINPKVPAQDVSGLIAHAKRNPGQLVFGSSGTGGSDHIAGAQFMIMAGIDMLHIPYRGAGPAIGDLLAGRVQVTFFSPLATRQYVETGALRRLAVTTKQRSPMLPLVPTIAEQALPDYDVMGWYGLMAPRGTPPDIVAALGKAAVEALSAPAVQELFAKNALSAGGGTPDAFGVFLGREVPHWERLARAVVAKGKIE